MAEEEVIEDVEIVEDEGEPAVNGAVVETEEGSVEVQQFQQETTTTREITVEEGEAVVQNGGDIEIELESEAVEVSKETRVVQEIQVVSEAESNNAEAAPAADDRTEDQVTEISEDKRGKMVDSAQPSLDEIVEIPVDVTEADVEAETPEAPEAPQEEFVHEPSADIPIKFEDVPQDAAKIESERPSAAESESAEPEPEPEPARAPEPTPPATPTNKKSLSRETSLKGSKTSSVEPEKVQEPASEPTPPATPTTKKPLKRETSLKGSKTPSVDVSEPTTPTSKSKGASLKGSKTASVEEPAAAPEKPVEEPVVYKELTLEEAPAEETPAAVVDVPIEEEAPAATMVEPVADESEPAAAMIELAVEQELAPEEEKAPVVVAQEPEATFEVPVESEAPNEVTKEPEPIRRASVERPSRRQMREEGIHVPIAPAPQPTPPPSKVNYVTYASFAPHSVHTPMYVPYSATISPVHKFQNEYTAGYNYRRATPSYVHSFDNYVSVGSFSQNLFAAERARARSRSQERRNRSTSSSYGLYYGPPPTRRRDTSLPSSLYGSRSSSAAVSRTTSYTNLMDYVESKNSEIRRSRSRDSVAGRLSRTPSRTYINSTDALNNYYDKSITNVDSYVRRLNEPYESPVSRFDTRYSVYTDRPYSPYISAVHHYDHLPREDSSTRRLKRWMIDNETPSTVRALYETRIDELERNLQRERDNRNRLEQERSYLGRELGHVNRLYTDTRSVSSALDTALMVNRTLRGRLENTERRYTGYPYYTPPYQGTYGGPVYPSYRSRYYAY